MRTDELIQRLGNDLAPVRPLAPPRTRAAVWLLCAATYVVAVAGVAWVRHGLEGVSAEPQYVAQQLALVAMGITAAAAAFASVVPGMNRRLLAVPLVPAAVVMLTLLTGCLRDLQQRGTLGFGVETDWPCVASIAVGGLALWGVALVMLRRGAPLAARTTSTLAALAALGAVNVEACLTRPHLFSLTVVLWHGLTIAVLVAVLAHVGPRLFTWRVLDTSSGV